MLLLVVPVSLCVCVDRASSGFGASRLVFFVPEDDPLFQCKKRDLLIIIIVFFTNKINPTEPLFYFTPFTIISFPSRVVQISIVEFIALLHRCVVDDAAV